jgi:hypothetical protein
MEDSGEMEMGFKKKSSIWVPISASYFLQKKKYKWKN